jgi:hypothetical protein
MCTKVSKEHTASITRGEVRRAGKYTVCIGIDGSGFRPQRVAKSVCYPSRLPKQCKNCHAILSFSAISFHSASDEGIVTKFKPLKSTFVI